jgi:L-threonylcarbamoyladenylate synthase
MIEKLTKDNFDEIVKKTTGIIKSGGIVVLPFDTVYGFACDPKNELAVERIYSRKGRDSIKPLGIAVSDFETIIAISDLSQEAQNFIKNKIPGPYTFIVRLKDQSLISKYCQQNGTCGIRIPDSKLITSVAKLSGGMIAQTSANKSGEGDCYSIDELSSQYSKGELEKIDLIVDGGELKKQGSSRIFDLTQSEPREIERK